MPAEFFSLWLGKSMTYTAARFSSRDMSLEEAQEEKINFHLDAANVAQGSRMLDIGCGWGTLLARGMQDRGAAMARGLTLSPLQKAYIDSRGIPGVVTALQSYEHFAPDRPFHAIVSVG